MRYALLTAVLLGLVVAAAYAAPLTGLTPTIAEMDRAMKDLQHQVARQDWDGARTELRTIRDGLHRSQALIQLLSSQDTHARFQQMLARIETAVNARDPSGLRSDAAELHQLWLHMMSF